VSVVVRVVREFNEGADAVTLEKALVLPDVPTMGSCCPISDGPGRKRGVVYFLATVLAIYVSRAGGDRDRTQGGP
jgi:hypothetical protein